MMTTLQAINLSLLLVDEAIQSTHDGTYRHELKQAKKTLRLLRRGRTLTQRRADAMLLLREHPQASYAEVGRMVGLSAKTVGRLAGKMGKNS